MITAPPSAKRSSRRSAFTLTELMVVIMVISILSSAVLFAMYGAVEEAKVTRTRFQITKINELLLTRSESYRTRRVRYIFPNTVSVPAQAQARRWLNRRPKEFARVRLLLLRELMRMEMPDRRADVWDAAITIPSGFVYQGNAVSVTLPPPAVMFEYQRRAPLATWTEANQDAECLYLILASIRDETSSGVDFLADGEIGDVDADGVPEILDAWGNPIGFLRWAPGFIAHPGPDFTWLTADDIPSYSTIQPFTIDDTGTYPIQEDRDAYDPLRVDIRASVLMPDAAAVGGTADAQYYFNYKLHPLVYSAGPDEAYEIIRWDYDAVGDPNVLIPFNHYRTGTNDSGFATAIYWPNDPYAILPNSKRRLGEPFIASFGYVDNITNQDVDN